MRTVTQKSVILIGYVLFRLIRLEIRLFAVTREENTENRKSEGGEGVIDAVDVDAVDETRYARSLRVAVNPPSEKVGSSLPTFSEGGLTATRRLLRSVFRE